MTDSRIDGKANSKVRTLLVISYESGTRINKKTSIYFFLNKELAITSIAEFVMLVYS